MDCFLAEGASLFDERLSISPKGLIAPKAITFVEGSLPSRDNGDAFFGEASEELQNIFLLGLEPAVGNNSSGSPSPECLPIPFSIRSPLPTTRSVLPTPPVRTSNPIPQNSPFDDSLPAPGAELGLLSVSPVLKASRFAELLPNNGRVFCRNASTSSHHYASLQGRNRSLSMGDNVVLSGFEVVSSCA